MIEDWDRERRQRALVESVLAGYQTGSVSVRRLVEDLQALVLELRLVPRAWLDDFQAEVNGLEALYAIALDRGVADRLPDDYLADADEAVRRMTAMMNDLERLQDADG